MRRAAGRNGTWCFTVRKPLFLRPEAPRLSGRMGLRRLGRGTSPPANPCSFVRKHHVFQGQGAGGGPGVVLHRPQTLIPSSGDTTSFSSRAAGRDGAWYLTARPFPFLSTHKERNSAGRKARCCSFIIHIFGSSLFPRGLPFGSGKHSFLNDGHERVGVDMPANPWSSVRTRQHAQDFPGPPAPKNERTCIRKAISA